MPRSRTVRCHREATANHGARQPGQALGQAIEHELHRQRGEQDAEQPGDDVDAGLAEQTFLPAALCSPPRCVQITVDWVTDLMSHMRQRDLHQASPATEPDAARARHAAEEADKTPLSKTGSWIMGSNIPGQFWAPLLCAAPPPVLTFPESC